MWRLPLCVMALVVGLSGCGGGGGNKPAPVLSSANVFSASSASLFSSVVAPGSASASEASSSHSSISVTSSASVSSAPSSELVSSSLPGISSPSSSASLSASSASLPEPGSSAASSSPSFHSSSSAAGSASSTRYYLAGSATGLSGSASLRLQAEAWEELLVVSAGDFAFTQSLAAGMAYEVSLVAGPLGQNCQLSNHFGVMASDTPVVQLQCVSNVATANLSGRITHATGLLVDSSLNDIFADYSDNSSPLRAQALPNLGTVQGFASYVPTGGDARMERFATSTNEDDYYRVNLQAGQVLQLQVVDFDYLSGERYGDLDLYLFDLQANLIAYSDGTNEFEELVVPADGEYLLNVWAYSGTSKYVLRLMPPGTASLGAKQAATFVPNEMIVQWEKQPKAAAGVQALASVELSHSDSRRPVLLKTQPGTSLSLQGSTRTLAATRQLAPLMNDLERYYPQAYTQRQTLRNIKTLRQTPGVSLAEPNYLRYAQRQPNDPGYRYQWHYNTIALPQAWDITTGTTAPGEEVVVAVLDTGVYLDHPDLAGQLLPGYDFISNPESAGDGDGIDNNPDDPGDSALRGHSSWHGTHVAGTIAAASNNNLGVAGVAWGAKILPVRVLGRLDGTSYDFIQGVRYAAGLANDSNTLPARRAQIINMSLGGAGGSLAEQRVFEEVRAAGIILVAASGNDNSTEASYPAAYPGVISVGATDSRGNRASYSNYGSSLDMVAPGGALEMDTNGDGIGDGVFSTAADDTSGLRQPSYRLAQGTSMAAPHVSGVIALVKSLYPALTPEQVDQLLASGQLTDARPVNGASSVGRNDEFGYGQINALKAVRVAADLRSGGDLPQWPVQLQVTPTSLNFGLASQAQLTLANQGGGNPQLTQVRSTQPWLQVNAAQVDEQGFGSYSVSINRQAVEPGFYVGYVVFNFAEQDPLLVQVAMQVGTTSYNTSMAPLYVLLLEANSLTEVMQTTPVQENGQWFYRFSDVPNGDYLIMAGSDVDADFYICTTGETCGGYPSMQLNQPFSVRGEDMSELDILVDLLAGFSTMSAQQVSTETRAPWSLRRLQ